MTSTGTTTAGAASPPDRGGLRALFGPASVAVVGASADPAKAGHAMMRSLAGFPGPLYPVNPRAGEVLGHRAWPSIAALPATPDLAVLVVPPGAVPPVLEECGRRGVAAAVVCAGGFAESGASGAELQRRAAAVARRHGLRVLGPNTSGLLRPDAGLFANFMPGVEQLTPGPAAFVAQSGGMNLLLSFLAAESGLGISLGVGLGNSVDVGFAEVLGHLADDPATSVVGLHIEGATAGRELYEAVRRLAGTKPVVALKVGHAGVAEFARSHTGALAGDHRITRAALRQAGAVVVDDPTALVDGVRALAGGRLPPAAQPGVALVTGQAGPGLVIADELVSAGIRMPALAPATAARLADLLPPLTHQTNPVDTGRPSGSFADVLAAVSADPGVDLLVVNALEEPGAFDPAVALGAVRAAGPRAVFCTQGPGSDVAKTAEVLDALGVPTYLAPERAARAVTALVEDARARHRLLDSSPLDSSLLDHHTPAGPVPVPSLAGGFTEDAAKALLTSFGIPVPRGRCCTGRAEAHEALRELGGPVVVKVLHPDIAHKTEVGGVHPDVRTPTDLDTALNAIDAIGLDGRRGYLVEEQAGPGAELLVGALRDPAFGPLLMLGLGGTAAELIEPAGIRLAPLTRVDAEELIDSLPPTLLTGFRGRPALDRGALAGILDDLSRVMTAHPELGEVEINPLRMTTTGPLALDALITLAPGDGRC